MQLRKVASKHRSFWEAAHGYQKRAVEHMCAINSAMLWLDPGMGKTAVTLAAFQELQEHGMAERMLVVAPLRVCQLVWRQEAQEWTEFRDLQFSAMLGSIKQREAALKAPADVYLINYENLQWLADKFSTTNFAGKKVPGKMPFDVITFDEVTRVKNAQGDRAKAMHGLVDKMRYRWGLTGTPSPNGYMDLFGQFRMIDGGAALGRYVTHYRDRFFQLGRNGFDYDLQNGAAARIEVAIKPYVLRASADDYLKLPPVVPHPIFIELDATTRKLYKEMKRDMLANLPGGVLTAANAAAVQSKLSQMANGAVYTTHPKWEFLHDAKLDALKALVAELGGAPLLVGYEFSHDLERIRAAFPDAPTMTGATAAHAQQIENDWNAGRIPVLPVHPASVGHGLNMQKGGAAHLCWFSQTWDYELYDQLLRRIRRQGSTAQSIVEHKLIVRDSIDETKSAVVNDKGIDMGGLLRAMKTEFERDDINLEIEGENDVRKLGATGAAAPTQPAAAPPQATPAGNWGSSAAPPQRETVQAKVAGNAQGGWGDKAPQQQNISSGAEDRVDPAQDHTAGYSPEVQQQLNGGAGQGETTAAPKPPRTRKKAETQDKPIEQRYAEIDQALAGNSNVREVLYDHETMPNKDYSITFDASAFYNGAISMGFDPADVKAELFEIVDRLRGRPF